MRKSDFPVEEVVMKTDAKVILTKGLWSIMMLTLALGTAACGSDNDNGPGPVPGPGPGGHGGPGSNLGQCLPIQPNVGMPIPFSGRNVLVNSVELVGGAIPPSQFAPSEYAGMQIGEMMIGGGQVGPFEATGPDGNIRMQIYQSGIGQQGNQYQANAEVHGIIELSAAATQEIYTRFGGANYYTPYPTGGYNGGYPYPTSPYQPAPQNNTVCASGIGMHAGLSGFGLTDVSVYLYLNRTVNGMALRFY